MDDTQIIDLYWDRDQGAITATAGKYGSFLHALSWNILRSHHDAEECVNDTYFRAWNAIPPERPSALRAWLGRITRNLSLDRWKAGRTQSRGAGMETLLGELDECIPDHRGPEQAAEERVLAECVYFMELLAKFYPQTLLERYKLEAPESADGYDLLQLAGRKRGYLVSGGEVNTERMAKALMDDYRSGKLGKLTLESPEEQNA